MTMGEDGAAAERRSGSRCGALPVVGEVGRRRDSGQQRGEDGREEVEGEKYAGAAGIQAGELRVDAPKRVEDSREALEGDGIDAADIGVGEYVYVYACHEDERELCELELRTLLGAEPRGRYVGSPRRVDPSRSPFVKLRLGVWCEAGSLPELAERVAALRVEAASFKVSFAETDDTVLYAAQRAIERELGLRVRGRAEMHRPARRFAAAVLGGGRWVFGECRLAEPVWLRHQQKPQNYSTALGTRVARAVVNLAAPETAGARMVDPCCGMGTVLIEAMSMGIDIVGFDLNPLAVRGARVNLAHFGLPEGAVALADMRKLGGGYTALVLDMPYNLCSVLPEAEQMEMLAAARRLASRAVIVATVELGGAIERAGFRLAGRCMVRKGSFARHIYVGE